MCQEGYNCLVDLNFENQQQDLLYLLNYYYCNSINVQGYILHAVTANCKMPKFKWLTAKSQNLGN